MSDNINARVKTLRKFLKLTQIEFAQKIGITTQQQIANIERDKSKVTESSIKLMCVEFGVNENWLRNGQGEMFDFSSKDRVVEQLAKEYNLNNADKSYIKAFVTKSPNDREKFLSALNNIAHFQTLSVIEMDN